MIITTEAAEELADLVKLSESRPLTAEELKRYYRLHGVPEQTAAAFASNGGPDSDVRDQRRV